MDIKSIGDLVGMAVVVASFGALLKWMLTRFEQGMREMTEALLAIPQAMRAEFRGLQAMMLTTHSTLLFHDYTAKGMTSEDQQSVAAKHYHELQREIAELRRRLLEDSNGL